MIDKLKFSCSLQPQPSFQRFVLPSDSRPPFLYSLPPFPRFPCDTMTVNALRGKTRSSLAPAPQLRGQTQHRPPKPHTPCDVDAMNSLIEMVILNNNWVRRLNAFRNMHRS